MKKPWVAGLLNVMPGAGYLYINWKRPFGWFLLAGGFCMIVGFFDPLYAEMAVDEDAPLRAWDLIAFLSGVLFLVAFIVDANMEANRHNEARGVKVSPHKQEK